MRASRLKTAARSPKGPHNEALLWRKDALALDTTGKPLGREEGNKRVPGTREAQESHAPGRVSKTEQQGMDAMLLKTVFGGCGSGGNISERTALHGCGGARRSTS